MRRREFITLLGGVAAVAWPLATNAQSGKVYRIGFLWDGPTVFPDALEAFRRGLHDLGYVEGRTIAIEYRWADGKPERMRIAARSAWRGCCCKSHDEVQAKLVISRSVQLSKCHFFSGRAR